MKKLLILACLILTACSPDNAPVENTPEAVINAYFHAEETGNFNQVKTLFSQGMKALGDDFIKGHMESDGKKFNAGKGIQSIDLRGKGENERVKNFHAVILLKSGKTINKYIGVKNENNEWKVFF